MDLPELGVGVVYFAGLEPWLEASASLIDVIEIEPQPLWYANRSGEAKYRLSELALARLGRFPQPKLVHGVGFPVGGSRAANAEHLEPFVATATALGSPWVSEHLSFNRARRGATEFGTGFLLPPLQSPEAVRRASSNIRRLSSELPVPFAFETGVSYLKPFPGEMSDGAFFRSVAEAADCGILLDLHNLWANERNGRQSVQGVVDELPLERVVEVHLAGGEPYHGYWMDAHSGPSPAELLELAAQVVPRLPFLKALVFEMMPDYIEARDLRLEDFQAQLRAMRRLWASRGRAAARGPAVSSSSRANTGGSAAGPIPADASLPGIADWEDVLGGLTVGHSVPGSLAERLARDPGLEVVQHLVSTMRGGMAVTALTLTCRLLMLELGDEGFRALLEGFWRSVTPETFVSEEAAHFGAYLKAQAPAVPYLEEVLAFELAAQQTLIEGSAPPVRFRCEPLSLLGALGEGRRPDDLTPGDFELLVGPLLPATGSQASRE